ncbi:hypothetical protein HKBW3C_01905, partial [Candidatus Hakubella thermalkaliphila]
IVKYIVENTLGALIEGKKKKVQGKVSELEKKLKASRGYNRQACEKELEKTKNSIIDEILSIKVLDPAMGSGHFLVVAADFLARALVDGLSGTLLESTEEAEAIKEAPDEYVPEQDEDDIRWARREVVERCIFGVDSNPLAVELAKLSLWLTTVAKDRPLSFLDHHLRCGNSLIGAQVENLATLGTIKTKKGKTEAKETEQLILFDESAFKLDMGRAVKDFHFIEAKASDTVNDIRAKERIYKELWQARLEKWKRVADLWSSAYFGNELGRTLYQALMDGLLGKPSSVTEELVKPYLERAEQLAEQKRFFHWQIEFPEIFYDEYGRKLDSPGFDVVVGNPPYLRIQGLQEIDSAQVFYFNSIFQSAFKNYDIYALFVEQGLKLLCKNGLFAFILPNKFIQAGFGKGLRELLSERRAVRGIVTFGHHLVFDDASTYTCLLFLAGTPQGEFFYGLGVPPSDSNALGVSLILLPERLIVPEPWTLGESATLGVLDRLREKSIRLEQITRKIFVGLQTSADAIYFLERVSLPDESIVKVKSHRSGMVLELESKILKPLLKGEDVHRYRPLDHRFYVIFPYRVSEGRAELLTESELSKKYPRTWEYLKQNEQALRAREKGKMDTEGWYGYGRTQNLTEFESPKIVFPDIAIEPSMTYDAYGFFYHTTTLYSLAFKEGQPFSHLFVLGILNSRALLFFIKNTGTPLRGGYYRYKTEYLEPFPIRRISFVTPKVERQKLLEEAKSLYEKLHALGSLSSILEFVSERLEEKHRPDPELVKRHNAEPLNRDWQIPESVLWEQSDVVHDILAFLTEKMIEMNKQKQNEIKGFLEWLEREIGAKVDELRNKTKIKAYHEHSFDDLLDVLKQNGKKLEVDPSRRDFQEKLKSDFDKSLAKLTLLKHKIEATDELIDQVVQKLYGLTEEEIKIVEESVK